MLTTEEEARTNWCPLVRIARVEQPHPHLETKVLIGGCNTDALGGNRVPESCRCIGSDCMMWRWVPYALHLQAGCALGYCGAGGSPWLEDAP